MENFLHTVKKPSGRCFQYNAKRITFAEAELCIVNAFKPNRSVNGIENFRLNLSSFSPDTRYHLYKQI